MEKKNVTRITLEQDEEKQPKNPTSPLEDRRKISFKDKEDYTIPVTYQSVSAEVQNVIDKISHLDRQDSIDNRHRSFSESEGRKDLDQQTYDLINELSVHRIQRKDFLKYAESNHDPIRDGIRRQFSGGADLIPQQTEKPNFMEQAKSTIRKITLQEEPKPPLNILDEALEGDHLISLELVEKKYKTSRQRGLTENEVKERLIRDGPNVLTPPKTVPLWLQFLKCLVGGFGIILWIAAILCIFAYRPLGDPKPDIYNIILAFVIVAVIVTQAVFFFVQERRSSNLMASFANMIPSFSQVLRDGNWQSVEAFNLVVGDVVRIREGDKVPADMRLFEVNQAKVEKSGLTGENEPIPLSTTSTDQNLYETRNLALFGTSIIEGSAAGIVINTSDRTVMGKIARVASDTAAVTTSLQKEVNYFTGLVAGMAVMACVIVVVGYYIGVHPSHPFLTVSAVITSCIAVVVSLLPEGTPVALAMILTLIARRMYTARILVKKLTVLETLGSATLIASDKTGTLTQNQMTLNHVWIASDRVQADLDLPSLTENKPKSINEPETQLLGCYKIASMGRSVVNPALVYLMQIMTLCNKTVFEESGPKWSPKMKQGQVRKIVGNPTEGALLKAADEYLDANELRRKTPMIKEIAFSSRKKYHLTIHQILERQLFANSGDVIQSYDRPHVQMHDNIILVKGAPEYVLGMCTKAVVDNTETIMNATQMGRIMKANELLATCGERVLAFAYRKLDSHEYPKDYQFNMDDEVGLTSDLCFLGLVGIIDPPREGVSDAIDECHTAHVRVMMVTGDHPITAVAIAKAVNIVTHENVNTIADLMKDVPLMASNSISRDKHNKIISKVKEFFVAPPQRDFKDKAIVISGTDMAVLQEKQWDYVLSHKEVVFARTTPQQKLQIVKESRLRGDVVAVTGDGVNDAPALKAADLGVAMGICGSDVSKEAANMVLLDDNFVTIVNGIKEGRLLFENLKKVVCYLFPNGSFSEILPVLALVFLGMPIPLSTFLMIIICIGSDMIGSIGLIHECAEADIMTRPPRNSRTDRLVSMRTILFAYFFVGIMESSIAFFMFFLTMWIEGNVPPNKVIFAYEHWGTDDWVPLKGTELNGTVYLKGTELDELAYKSQTAFFVSLVMTQLWNLLAVRTRYQSIFSQKFQMKLFYFMLGEVAVVILVCYLPVINVNMYSRPATWYQWVIPLAMGSMILVFDEIRKFFVRKYPNGLLRKLAW